MKLLTSWDYDTIYRAGDAAYKAAADKHEAVHAYCSAMCEKAREVAAAAQEASPRDYEGRLVRLVVQEKRNIGTTTAPEVVECVNCTGSMKIERETPEWLYYKVCFGGDGTVFETEKRRRKNKIVGIIIGRNI